MKIQPSVRYSHTLLSQLVQKGDTVIDATVGKGNDTEFLSELVGQKGKVYGFDVQEEAIKYTKQRLDDKNLSSNVSLFNTGHENIEKLVDGPINAAIFNLGYLPGSNKDIITKPDTTLTAIKACLNKLKINGIVVLVLYYGHVGGPQEKHAVIEYAQSLNQKEFSVMQYQFINQVHCPPILLAIQKNAN
ncbi:methyltransferase domain-containing protein [Lactobacillus kunkeei]|uniref:Methyltransferase domain-containing protein n=1 Tax=Apilactobacillus nanyangensis TaxID=2799579 RepID=A0ABT0HYQ4_9LACO|nr:class I SAM-dependent methyltransferase [Apilactobacillus nanyangensis]MBC6388238.1 methyltransferase domain-containing protein [Apilactobacillus kunkeei]MCK8612052.1 methyltransferase domain-containing protein [Apilactobacillus nanyangensis]TMT02826.1 methyltransferase domain-containing protein [Apilactobacillus kunkeei]TMT04322.1 methyltransferase domain-containing protein [Apilactobacillus kunkeei]